MPRKERNKSRNESRGESRGRGHDVDRSRTPDPNFLSADGQVSAGLRAQSVSPALDNAGDSSGSPRLTEHHRNRSVDASLDKLSDHITSDAVHLLDKFRSQFDTTARDFRTKPNVLVAGCTGAGKSTLINKVFGRVVAQTGSGVPITQHFDRYELENESVVIYDSKGLEVGSHDGFVRTTSEFLAEGGSGDDVHVVWYIINSAGSRFQPFEGDVCKSLFNNLPIIFILNKADLSMQQDREQLRQSIVDLNLGNCIAILDTICTPSLQSLKIPDTCPQCGSDDIDIKRKHKKMLCEDCGHTATLEVDTGLGMLVSRTMDALPALARERFVSAQRVSMHHKNVTARKIIREFHDFDFKGARRESQLFKVVAKMLIRLSILWEFREYGHEYGTEIAKEHMGQYSLRDRVFLLMHKQDKQFEERLAHTAALGLVWNRCVRSLYISLFMHTFNLTSSVEAMPPTDDLATLVDHAFAELNPEAIDKVAETLHSDKDAFAHVLDAEFPSELEADTSVSVNVPINHQLDSTVVVSREAMAGDEDVQVLVRGASTGAEYRHELTGTTGHYMMASDAASVVDSVAASRHRHRKHKHTLTSTVDSGGSGGSRHTAQGRHTPAISSGGGRHTPAGVGDYAGRGRGRHKGSTRGGVKVRSSDHDLDSSHGHRRHASVDHYSGSSSMAAPSLDTVSEAGSSSSNVRRSSKKHY